MRVRNKKMVIFGVFWLVVAAVIFTYSWQPAEVHEHADFAVYLDGVRYNFSQEKYMTDNNKTLSEYTHLHDMDGNVIHKHVAGVTLGYFFGSLGMRFNSTCFVLDNGTSYCSGGNKTLVMMVKGEPSHEYDKYEFRDLDRILISFGPTGTVLNEQMSSVTDNACIQSMKCPERGTPGNESCSGGLCTE